MLTSIKSQCFGCPSAGRDELCDYCPCYGTKIELTKQKIGELSQNLKHLHRLCQEEAQNAKNHSAIH